jgi:hypothetical protein
MPVASPPYGPPGRAIGSAVNMFNPGCDRTRRPVFVPWPGLDHCVSPAPKSNDPACDAGNDAVNKFNLNSEGPKSLVRE